jgi:hypothetical protein
LKAELLFTRGTSEWKLEVRTYPGAPIIRQRLWVREAVSGNMEERNLVEVPQGTESPEEKARTPSGMFAFELGSPFSFALYRYTWIS